MQVKNYVYISDVKIDLFCDQTASSDIEKTGAEYGVDVKILKWVGKRETFSAARKASGPADSCVRVPSLHHCRKYAPSGWTSSLPCTVT
ncbi:MAG TPA: hypothetical protein VEV41_01785 [Terriglobales bacterium]|nr:hypothetical protein [Terriglobales bacterium]